MARVNFIAWAPSGDRIALGGDDGFVSVHAAKFLGFDCQRIHGDVSVTQIAWAPNCTKLVVAAAGHSLCLLDAYSLDVLAEFYFRNCVFSMTWAPDGKHISIGSYNACVRLFSPDTLQLEQKLELDELASSHSDYHVTALSWRPDGKALVIGYDSAHTQLRLVSARYLRILAESNLDATATTKNCSGSLVDIRHHVS